MTTQDTLTRLERWFSQLEGSITAFSGGVDSTLVLKLSRDFLGPERAIGCISDSPSLKRRDLEEAKTFCRRFDIQLEIIHTRELDDRNYASNPSNRCFACKSHLYQDLGELQRRFPTRTILNGTNADDLGDYRPGLKAAADHAIRSPLSECGVDKQTVRQLARHLELPNWDKPASPCLSSRIPYGSPVTRGKLQQIETAESVLERYGFTDGRVRHFGTEAKIEVPFEQIEALTSRLDRISAALRALGFETISVDREGFVSGKLNRALSSNA
ncbi:ATP-dependent sacrificial sulfur transferase LarE [Pelagicoccus sp. SDUM812003]|uniref:ATP-dependent sacrificial sulfur transferase LarE n=1 Tax=Pelagicoccus sp. SDUM812003 TaxID=3041267 RepID=UPI00280FEB5C|nr:ATP-dependent sacrificial sulfur transferase LarE [Pelagicoccus sp. SDUM812003]MDQ8202686.1 ATP-dependent sacrificial sulfur transferase LarE [Pelagicoccus sp. SDUM812003]